MHEACVLEPAASGLTEHQPCSRMKADVVEGDPLRLDAVEPPVCPKTAVTPEADVFFKITAASIGSVSALFHCHFIHVEGVFC